MRRPRSCARPRDACPTSRWPASAAAPTRSACWRASSASRRCASWASRRRGEGLAGPARRGARRRLAGRAPRLAVATCSRTPTARWRRPTRSPPGLDYPGIGPQLSALYEAGRLEILSATDDEAIEGIRLLTRTEGILPALEPAHAIAALGAWLAGRRRSRRSRDDALVLLGLSGRGDKDLAAIADRLRTAEGTDEPREPAAPGGRDRRRPRRRTRAGGRASRRRSRGGRGRPRGAHPLRRGRLPGRRDVRARSRSRSSTPARTWSRSACRTRTRSPMARRSSARAASRSTAGATLDRSVELVARDPRGAPGRAARRDGLRQPGARRPGRQRPCCERLAEAGVTGLILADLTPDEGAELEAPRPRPRHEHRLPRDARPRRPSVCAMIASAAVGFLYAVSLAGVTGARTIAAAGRRAVPGPRCARSARCPSRSGFGVSRPEHARTLAPVGRRDHRRQRARRCARAGRSDVAHGDLRSLAAPGSARSPPRG